MNNKITRNTKDKITHITDGLEKDNKAAFYLEIDGNGIDVSFNTSTGPLFSFHLSIDLLNSFLKKAS